MTIICWDKPQKIQSTAEHNKMYSSDSGIAGTFVPNMSAADMLKWKGTFKKPRLFPDSPYVELRKTFSRDDSYAQVFIIVAINGHNYNKVIPGDNKSTNVRISTNGVIAMTFEELNELQQAIIEAQDFLYNFLENNDKRDSQ